MKLQHKPQKKRENKYGNKKTFRIINGTQVWFDSRKEATHYDNLYLQLRQGHISQLTLQPSYDLIPTQKWNGATLRKITYTADFRYVKNNKTFVIDVKGFLTDIYKIKMRLFILQNPDIIFQEV